jgi:hypothetical protein
MKLRAACCVDNCRESGVAAGIFQYFSGGCLEFAPFRELLSTGTDRAGTTEFRFPDPRVEFGNSPTG